MGGFTQALGKKVKIIEHNDESYLKINISQAEKDKLVVDNPLIRVERE